MLLFMRKAFAKAILIAQSKCLSTFHRTVRPADIVVRCYWTCIAFLISNGHGRKPLGCNRYQVFLPSDLAAFYCARSGVIDQMSGDLLMRIQSSGIDFGGSIRIEISESHQEGFCVRGYNGDLSSGSDIADFNLSAFRFEPTHLLQGGPANTAKECFESEAYLIHGDGGMSLVCDGASIGVDRRSSFRPDIRLDSRLETVSSLQGTFHCEGGCWYLRHRGRNESVVDGFMLSLPGETAQIFDGSVITFPGQSCVFRLTKHVNGSGLTQ